MRTPSTVLAAWLVTSSAFSQVLYDIDFNSPAQNPNALVRTGSAPQFVSAINFGSPMVVPSFGGLTDQPLRLDLAGNMSPFYYDQIQLNVAPAQTSSLDLSFDFTSSGLAGSTAPALFTVLVDGPPTSSLIFDATGQISLFSGGIAAPVGQFADGETFRVLLHIDRVQRTWAVSKNGTLLGSASFLDPSPIEDFRFSYGKNSLSGPPDSSAAGIDNVLVTIVPEPSSLALAGIWAGTSLASFRKARRHRGS